MRFKNYFLLLLLLCSAQSGLFAQESSSIYASFKERRQSPGKTIYYIDPKAGNDNNTGTQLKKPWKTFKPVNKLILAAGDVVQVLSSGEFHESLVLMGKGTLQSPVKLKFAAGRYDFFPAKAIKKQLHITNTNDRPYEQKAIALMFDSAQFVNVEATAAKFIFRGKTIETFINNCQNISLSGMSYDYHRPTVSELTVLNTGANYADVTIHADSKFSIKDSVITWQGEGWSYQPDSYWQVLNTATDEISRINIPMENVRFVAQGGQNVRVYFKGSPVFKKGFTYQNRDVTRDCAGLFIQHSKNVELKNINIYFMHGMGVVSQFCENIKMTNLSVKPEASSKRTCAAWADILHFTGCKGKIEVGNSYLSAANDDAINVHGTHLKIVKIPAPNKIHVVFKHSQTYGFDPFSAKDSLDFIHPESLLPFGSNVVLQTERVNDKEFVLTLQNAVPKDLQVNDVVENVTATPQLWVHHTTIARIPTRGILTTTRRKTLIENNTFLKTEMSAVFVNDDASSWYESGIVRDLVIRNNNFIKCGGPVINIHPENTVDHDQKVHANISVLNNTFDMKDGLLFAAKSTSNINIKGNKITVAKLPESISSLLKFEKCEGVTEADNSLKATAR